MSDHIERKFRELRKAWFDEVMYLRPAQEWQGMHGIKRRNQENIRMRQQYDTQTERLISDPDCRCRVDPMCGNDLDIGEVSQ